MEPKRSKGGAAMLKAGGRAGSWPTDCSAFVAHGAQTRLNSENVLAWARANATLLEYLYPRDAPGSVEAGWRATSEGCSVVANGCWCFHVAGSMVKARNPRGHKRCAPKDRVLDCTDPTNHMHIKAMRNCSCFAQAPSPSAPCLFGDMRPAKLLAIIGAARALGIDHIIEQGRYGGLSAYIYALHGFRVTSVELLPLSEVTEAMRSRAPSVRLIDADGRAAVAKLVGGLSPAAAARTLVIFDGEKRQTAYETFNLVRSKVALAAFDDTNLDDGAFPSLLRARREDAWHTWDCEFMRRHSDARQLGQLSQQLRRASAAALSAAGEVGSRKLRRQGQLDEEGRLVFHGGMEDLSRFHTTLVLGGAAR